MNQEDKKQLIMYLLFLVVILYILSNLCSYPVKENYENEYPIKYAEASDMTVDNKGRFTKDFDEPEMGNRNNEEYDVPVYNKTTNSLMTGKTTPAWIAPAWNPEQKMTNNVENDPRMLYNKCSLSCCSKQYPTPFIKEDPNVYDRYGKRKYVASNYMCTNQYGSGCVCITKTQTDNFRKGNY